MIYLDNAATTREKPKEVVTAVAQAMCRAGNAGRGAGEASLAASRLVYEAREAVAALFDAPSPLQVAFTANATEALNTAVNGLLTPADHVITTALEHNSVLRPLYRLQKEGLRLTVLPPDETGCIAPEAFAGAVRPDTKAVVCTHASNVTGNLLDIQAIGNICREHKLLFVLDAAQTAGLFPVSVKAMGISALCFTGHKSLFGPQGTGGIVVAEGLSVRPLKVGGSGIRTYDREHPKAMPTALEAGTLNTHGITGLLAALLFRKRVGQESIRRREEDLARRFVAGVKELPRVRLYGNFRGEHRAPIVALNLGEEDSAKVSDVLMEQYAIETRAGGHCAPLMHEALGTGEQGVVRFSFSYFNTEEEVDAAVSALKSLAADIP